MQQGLVSLQRKRQREAGPLEHRSDDLDLTSFCHWAVCFRPVFAFAALVVSITSAGPNSPLTEA